MWLSHVAPLLSVIGSSAIAYKINFNELQVKDYKVAVLGPIKGGSLNPSSLHQLTFDSQVVGHLIRIGLTIAIISLTVGYPIFILFLFKLVNLIINLY